MKDENCIFCKIANGDIPSTTLYEDEQFRVIFDLAPATKGHVLILPKEHAEDLPSLPEALSSRVMPLAGKIGAAMKKGLGVQGFNVIQNNGEVAGQTVYHFHTHIIPRYGREDVALWTPKESDPEELKALCEKIQEKLS